MSAETYDKDKRGIWRCDKEYAFDLKKSLPVLADSKSTEGQIARSCHLLLTDDPKIIKDGMVGRRKYVCHMCGIPKVPCNCIRGYYFYCTLRPSCPHRDSCK